VAALGLTAAAIAGGVSLQRYSETDAFCGLTCHRAMAPQHFAHRSGTHASVRCVECHIGSGVMAHVAAKARGTRQLWGMLANDFSRPIRMPRRAGEPMQPRCERCHDTAELPDTLRLHASRFGYDATNRAQSLHLRLHLGTRNANAGDATARDAHSTERSSPASSVEASGGAARSAAMSSNAVASKLRRVTPSGSDRRGIGWHMLNPASVSYVAADEQATQIPWVAVQHADGTVTTYISQTSPLSPSALAAMPRVPMDCVDCHNRVGHRLLTPDQALDADLQNGTLARQLPGIKRALGQALRQAEPLQRAGATHGTAPVSLRDQVANAYRSTALTMKLGERELAPAQLELAVTVAEQVSARALDAELQVGWGTYADHVGHRYAAGCFRCHDGLHVSSDGKRLTNDCSTSCHAEPQLEPVEPAPAPPSAPRSRKWSWHPFELPMLEPKVEAHDRLLCVDCHGAGRVPSRACEDCHHAPGI
jgi:hypothetical protein